MRLLRLDLDRYGPFTDRTLHFRADARLHLVFGRNEAGKSSALAAVGDLLFGFGHRTSYDFRHDKSLLRVGAEIVARDGTRLAFRRRKGTKNTLLAAGSDTLPLPDDALAPFLGGIDREVFARAFGLSTEALRRGGEEMLSADGSAGATLLAAASGLSGLTDLRRRLEEDADAIYAPAGRKRRFNDVRGRLEEAERALAHAVLRPDAWAALNARIETLEAGLADIDTRRRAVVTDRDRLKRQTRVAPLVAALDRIEADRAAVADLDALPVALLGALTAARAARTEAIRARTEAERAATEAGEKRAGIRTDPALVGTAADIIRLFGESGAHVKGAADLPRLEAEARRAADDLAILAVRLGLDDHDALESHQPADAALARVQRLGRDQEARTREARRLMEARATERAEADRLEAERAAGGAPADPAPLAERLAGLAPALSRLEQAGPSATRLADLRQEFTASAGRLRPALADPRALARLPLPDVAEIRAARDRDSDLRAERARLEKAEASARSAVDDTRRERDALAAGRPLATPERIAAARESRNAAFAPLRAALAGAPDAPAGMALGAALATFETLGRDADALADAAVADADRVARHALLNEAHTRARRELDQATAALEQNAEALSAIARAWETLWQGTGLTPDTPARMESWRGEVAALLTLDAEARRLEAGLATLDAEAGALFPALTALARDLEVAPPADGGSPRSAALLLADLLRVRLKGLDARWQAGRTLATRLAEAHRRIAALDTEIASLDAARQQGAADWAGALAAIGLPASAGPEEAEAALDAWRAVPELLRTRTERARRAAGIRRNAETFARDVARLVETVAPDLAGRPAEQAIETLNQRLAEAERQAARHRDASAGLDSASLRLATARTAEAAAATAVAELLSGAGLDPDTDLDALVPRLEARQALLDRRAALERQIRDSADGLGIAEARAELADFDRAGADATLARLEDEAARLDATDRQTFSELKSAEAERALRESGIGAEVAAQERALAAAELGATMREWLVLKAGARLLSAAIERHREADQDPVLLRAGALFARLTDGAFSGLAQHYDERDRAVIVGVRADGGTVPVGRAEESRSPMSEGTRDQMFLALRLAFLEAHARRGEPAPFLGDDLFTTFDDGRTAAGLSVLAEVGASVQPILFTHHAHVVELARDRLGDAVDVIDLGRTG